MLWSQAAEVQISLFTAFPHLWSLLVRSQSRRGEVKVFIALLISTTSEEFPLTLFLSFT